MIDELSPPSSETPRKPHISTTIDEFNRHGYYCTDQHVKGLFALTPAEAYTSYLEMVALFATLANK